MSLSHFAWVDFVMWAHVPPTFFFFFDLHMGGIFTFFRGFMQKYNFFSSGGRGCFH